MRRIPDTDVWFACVEADPRIVTTYQFQIDPPKLGETVKDVFAAMEDAEKVREFATGLFLSAWADPFNPHKLFPSAAFIALGPDRPVEHEKWESVLTLPRAEPFPYPIDEERTISIENHSFSGEAIGGARRISVYLPPGYNPKGAYPLLVILDGEVWLKIARAPEILDAAIRAQHLPPLVAAFWHNLHGTSRMEEMACNPALPRVLADEFLPWLRKQYALVDDPTQTIVAGHSFGGLASAFIGLERADSFGSALIMSPSLWYVPNLEPQAGELVRGEWLTREYQARERQPLRLFLSVGSLERNSLEINHTGDLSMVDLARRFRDTVTAQGYEVMGYLEQPGGHDYASARRVLPIGLANLLGGS